MFAFLLSTVLLLPALMLAVGFIWKKHPPQKRNYFYGYRTSRSMKSDESWRFAHLHFAKTWLWLGSVLFPCSAIVMLVFRNDFEFAAIGLMLFQVLAVFLSIVPTERALKAAFDDDGNLKRSS